MGSGYEEFLADLKRELMRVVRSITPVEAYGAADQAARSDTTGCISAG